MEEMITQRVRDLKSLYKHLLFPDHIDIAENLDIVKEMKLFLFIKSMSRTVPEEDHEEEEDDAQKVGGGACTQLTVWRKSLVMTCNGFTVIDSSGNLVYRVDNYMGRADDIVLMDAVGKSLLSMSRRKKFGLSSEWMVYEGEDESECCAKTKSWNNNNKPLCCVRKNKNILQTNNNVLAHVFRGSCDTRHAYVIQGSYANRSCKVSDQSGRVVAEIKRKEATTMAGGISFGADVFVLIVQPNFDPVFAMALVLILDQMF